MIKDIFHSKPEKDYSVHEMEISSLTKSQIKEGVSSTQPSTITSGMGGKTSKPMGYSVQEMEISSCRKLNLKRKWL